MTNAEDYEAITRAMGCTNLLWNPIDGRYDMQYYFNFIALGDEKNSFFLVILVKREWHYFWPVDPCELNGPWYARISVGEVDRLLSTRDNGSHRLGGFMFRVKRAIPECKTIVTLARIF